MPTKLDDEILFIDDQPSVVKNSLKTGLLHVYQKYFSSKLQSSENDQKIATISNIKVDIPDETVESSSSGVELLECALINTNNLTIRSVCAFGSIISDILILSLIVLQFHTTRFDSRHLILAALLIILVVFTFVKYFYIGFRLPKTHPVSFRDPVTEKFTKTALIIGSIDYLSIFVMGVVIVIASSMLLWIADVRDLSMMKHQSRH